MSRSPAVCTDWRRRIKLAGNPANTLLQKSSQLRTNETTSDWKTAVGIPAAEYCATDVAYWNNARQSVTAFVTGKSQLVTDLLRGNWCNGFWALTCVCNKSESMKTPRSRAAQEGLMCLHLSLDLRLVDDAGDDWLCTIETRSCRCLVVDGWSLSSLRQHRNTRWRSLGKHQRQLVNKRQKPVCRRRRGVATN